MHAPLLAAGLATSEHVSAVLIFPHSVLPSEPKVQSAVHLPLKHDMSAPFGAVAHTLLAPHALPGNEPLGRHAFWCAGGVPVVAPASKHDEPAGHCPLTQPITQPPAFSAGFADSEQVSAALTPLHRSLPGCPGVQSTTHLLLVHVMVMSPPRPLQVLSALHAAPGNEPTGKQRCSVLRQEKFSGQLVVGQTSLLQP
jgi:hypothetical protein